MDLTLLDSIIECSVCLERLKHDARVLPCQHTFCLNCLRVRINDLNAANMNHNFFFFFQSPESRKQKPNNSTRLPRMQTTDQHIWYRLAPQECLSHKAARRRDKTEQRTCGLNKFHTHNNNNNHESFLQWSGKENSAACKITKWPAAIDRSLRKSPVRLPDEPARGRGLPEIPEGNDHSSDSKSWPELGGGKTGGTFGNLSVVVCEHEPSSKRAYAELCHKVETPCVYHAFN